MPATLLEAAPHLAAEHEQSWRAKHEEEYAHSQAALRRWGGALAAGNLVSYEELQGYESSAFADYRSALREMLRTDSEFRHELDIDDKREHNIVDGKIQSADGQTMVDIIATGVETSKQRAAKEPAFEQQVVRDRGDEIIARRVDALEPGQALFTLSLEPKRELLIHNDVYSKLGYREGLSYIQWYSKRADGQSVVAGSFSVDLSDEAIWRQMFAEQDVVIPEGTNPNAFIRHGFVRDMDPEAAEQFVQSWRERFYQLRGAGQGRYSITEYEAEHEPLVLELFSQYYPRLAEAVESGENNDTMRDLARSLQAVDIAKLKPEIKQTLMRVANSQKFTAESGKVMDSIIRYAVVEELRKGLYERLNSRRRSLPQMAGKFSIQGSALSYGSVMANELLAQNVSEGVAAGRNYGGCPGQIELSEDLFGEGSSFSPQEAFGGRGGGGGGSWWLEQERKKLKKDTMECVNCPDCSTFHDVLHAKNGKFTCKNKKCGKSVPAK